MPYWQLGLGKVKKLKKKVVDISGTKRPIEIKFSVFESTDQGQRKSKF